MVQGWGLGFGVKAFERNQGVHKGVNYQGILTESH